jgi:starvation-inducible outer membrane lipoprotein
MGKILVRAVALAGLLGCGPAISTSLQQQTGPPVIFADLAAHPENYQGRLVLLGGEVMSVTVKNGGSLLTVNQQNLAPNLRPVGASGGNFVVESAEWLSPGSYVPQRKVTVAGVFKGRKDGLPWLEARQIFLWEHPYKLIAVPKEWYPPELEYWYTPPYYDPWRPESPWAW